MNYIHENTEREMTTSGDEMDAAVVGGWEDVW